jgi:redox-sensitive bicupin YhaK (pirin superfamily)
MKRVQSIQRGGNAHWVGDGFPVRTIFSYQSLGEPISPFLLLDYAGPAAFPPSDRPRGVEQHPHRGFETVTIVYQGELEHRDSAGHAGRIGPGDVQWMTAAAGILHEEMHAREFTRRGGTLEMVQLWVNLPARFKMSPPRYQTLVGRDIPRVALADGGEARVIAGDFRGVKGPAKTFTPINLWDLRLQAGRRAELRLSDGHTAALFVLHGKLLFDGTQRAGEADLALLARSGEEVVLEAEENATFMVLAGEPIDEPVVGYGPFVMNTQEEIRQAIADHQSGRLGRIAP